MFTGNLANVQWAYIGTQDGPYYSVDSAAATKVPGVFLSVSLTPEEVGIIDWVMVEKLVRIGVEPDSTGEAVIIHGVAMDGRAVSFSTISSFSFSGVFAPGVEGFEEMDDWQIVNGEIVPA